MTTLDKQFWIRLKSFISNVQVNDAPGETEKEMTAIYFVAKMIAAAKISTVVFCSLS